MVTAMKKNNMRESEYFILKELNTNLHAEV